MQSASPAPPPAASARDDDSTIPSLQKNTSPTRRQEAELIDFDVIKG